jgi:hypothetical protein
MEIDQQQEPEESSPIFLVPDVILEEKIFARSGNLKNLSLSCKYFHDLISKSQLLTKRFRLKIEEQPEKDPLPLIVSTILKSKRNYSCVRFEKFNCSDSSYLELIQHFKDSITDIWFWQCSLNWLALADLFKTVRGLEELNFSYNRTPISKAGCDVDFSKFGKLKKVCILNHGDISVVSCMPETENLEIELDELDSRNSKRLKQYLETHTELTKFSILIYDMGESDSHEEFSEFPDASVNFKLTDCEIKVPNGLHTCSESQFTNNLFNFIKSQAESLKNLKLEGFAMDLNVTQNLIESLKVLESVEFDCTKFRRSAPFVAKNFTLPKLRKLKLSRIYDFPLFNKFPNLEELEIYNQPAVIVKAAAQHCPEIKKLVLWSFDSRPSNFFLPNLVALQIYYFNINELDVNFVLKHKKLERLELGGDEVNEVKLKKILEGLPNLKHLKISFMQSYVREEAEYQRRCAANKQILKKIWPLLGNLKTLAVSGINMDKYAIYQEFPMIPGLTIIN